MIRLLHILLFISLPFIASSQFLKGDDLKIKEKSRLIGQVTIGSKSFDNSAILTLTATDKGILITRLTTPERNAIGSPSTGLLIYNITTNQFEFFETTWQVVGAAGNTIYSGDDNLSSNRTVTMGANSLTFSGNLTTFKGIDATSSNFVVKFQDNVNTDLLTIRNDGAVFINTTTAPFGSKLSIETPGVGLSVSATVGNCNFFLAQSQTNQTLHNIFTDGSESLYILSDLAGTFKVRLGSDFSNLNQMTIGDIGAAPSGGSVFEVLASGNVLFNSLDANNNSTRNSGKLTLSGNYDVDFSPVITPTEFDADIQVIVVGADTGRLAFSVQGNEGLSIDENGIVTIGGISYTETSTTLGASVTTFAVSSTGITLTGDSGGNTIATITGFTRAEELTITFTGGNVTITDDNSHAANSVDLSAALTGADDMTLKIRFNGTSWYEVSRSTN